MKLVVFSDLHAHNFAQFSRTLENGRNSRFQATLNVLEQIRQFCLTNKVDVVFFLGDMFHARTKIDVDVYQQTWMAFRRLAKAVGSLYILIGNHDQYDKHGTQHSLDAFSAFATVIDQPVVARVESELSFAAHPFTVDYEDWKGFVGMLPQGLDFFFFHQGIDEAGVGAFDIPIKAAIAVRDFPAVGSARWCVGGHYHRSQILFRPTPGSDSVRRWGGGPTPTDGVMFAGSPLQHSFGEWQDPPKCFWYWESVTSSPLPIYTQAPTFHRFTSAEALARAVQDGEVDPVGDYVRLVCTEAERDAWRGAGLAGMAEIQVEMEATDRVTVERESPQAANEEELLRFYVGEQNPTEFDADTLVRLGLDLLADA